MSSEIDIPIWTPRARAALFAVAANLLTSTLSPASTMPVAQAWPNPPVRAAAASGVYTSGIPLPLQVESFGVPFVQADWPVPAPRAARLEVTVSTVPSRDADSPAVYDWPKPPTRRPVALDTQPPPNLLITTLSAAAATQPFVQADWPTPRRARATGQIQVEGVVFDYQIPPSSGAWPAPTRRAVVVPALVTGVPFAIAAPAPETMPPLPAAWSDPVVRTRASGSGTDVGVSFALTATTMPPAQVWALPQLRPVHVPSPVAGVPLALLEAPRPFIPPLWENPAVRRVRVVGGVSGSPIWLLVVDTEGGVTDLIGTDGRVVALVGTDGRLVRLIGTLE